MKRKLLIAVDLQKDFIDGVLGHMEDDTPRMVRTPWSDTEMPFEKAAEITDAFLDTAFLGGRHQRRIDMLDHMETLPF